MELVVVVDAVFDNAVLPPPATVLLEADDEVNADVEERRIEDKETPELKSEDVGELLTLDADGTEPVVETETEDIAVVPPVLVVVVAVVVVVVVLAVVAVTVVVPPPPPLPLLLLRTPPLDAIDALFPDNPVLVVTATAVDNNEDGEAVVGACVVAEGDTVVDTNGVVGAEVEGPRVAAVTIQFTVK